MSMGLMIVMVVVLAGMMFWSSRNNKKQQQKVQDFRRSLEAGTEVITIGGLIGKVVSVDEQFEEIVLDSEGSLMRFTVKSISKEYVRPAFVSDDEVDEKGNPLPDKDDNQGTGNQNQAQTPIEQASLDISAAQSDSKDEHHKLNDVTSDDQQADGTSSGAEAEGWQPKSQDDEAAADAKRPSTKE